MNKKWIELILGQGGAIVILAIVLFVSFQYFSEVIEAKDSQSIVTNEKLIEYIGANTRALEHLSGKIESCQR